MWKLLRVWLLGVALTPSTSNVAIGSKSSSKREQFEKLAREGRTQIDLGWFGPARETLQAALKLKPSSSKIANDLGVVLLQWASDDVDERHNFEVQPMNDGT